MEQYLGRYSGLILYLKEMDEVSYAKLCAVCIILFHRQSIKTLCWRQAYFSAASELHCAQIKAILSIYNGLVKKLTEEDAEQSTS